MISISALALANEVTFGLLVLGFIGVVVTWFIQNRKLKVPAGLPPWIGMFFAAGVLVLLLGGIFTDMARSILGRITGQAAQSFYSNSFALTWPPEVVSSHFGRLVLTNPYDLIVAALEFGPALLAFPLTMIVMWRSVRRGNWYQAAFWMSGLAALGALIFVYSGSAGISATTRILEGTINVCKLAFVPLLWLWSRDKSPAIQGSVIVLGLIATVG